MKGWVKASLSWAPPTRAELDIQPEWVPGYTTATVDALVDDHAGDITAAAAAAGVNGVVGFTGGSTYTVDRPVVMLEGQTWTSVGTGRAVIKRITSPVTTLAAGAIATDVTVTVDDTTGFAVGQYVSPHDTSADTGEYLTTHVISDITGPVITFTNGLESAYDLGDSFVLAFPMVQMPNDNAIMEGIDLDGNRDNNDTFLSWERHHNAQASGTGQTIRSCIFREAQGDCLSDAATNLTVQDCYAVNANGSFVHFTGSTNSTLHDIVTKDTNLQSARVRHAEAAFTWSLSNAGVECYNISIIDSSTAAFSDVFSGSNTDVYIHDCTVIGATQFFYAYGTAPTTVDIDLVDNVGIELSGTYSIRATADVDDIVVSGNTMSKPFQLLATNATDTGNTIAPD